MALPKARLRLVGECNRCGLCCTATKNGKTLYCHNLQRTDAVGVPGATFCRAYAIRFPGMPIMMYDSLGEIQALGMCSHKSEVDEENIAQWIGKGCSLRIDDGKRR
jgi:hypothetical protein